MRFSYHTEQLLPHPVGRVFNFFADPYNLPRLMPAWNKARIDLASILPPRPRPGRDSGAHISAAGVGTRLTLSFLPFPYSPVRIRWQAEITEFSWDSHFCDRQTRGPFVYWHHCHYVQPFSYGAETITLVADDLEYELPFSEAGELANRLFVRRHIERAFEYRQARLATILSRDVQLPFP